MCLFREKCRFCKKYVIFILSHVHEKNPILVVLFRAVSLIIITDNFITFCGLIFLKETVPHTIVYSCFIFSWASPFWILPFLTFSNVVSILRRYFIERSDSVVLINWWSRNGDFIWHEKSLSKNLIQLDNRALQKTANKKQGLIFWKMYLAVQVRYLYIIKHISIFRIKFVLPFFSTKEDWLSSDI